jgi:SAM-dependent methyltransferase
LAYGFPSEIAYMSNPGKLRANYGVDAPTFVAALSIGGLACILIAVILRILGGYLHPVLVVSVPVLGVVAGGIMLIGAALMLWSSKFGKLIERRRLILSLQLRGHETILDVGCGRGLLLTEAAKYLKSGKAIGIDLWQSRDQSGNTAEAALANARAENVAEHVEIKTGDMLSLPIENDSIDVVVSSLAIHNIQTREGRVRAIEEISRVLKPGGRVALLDLSHSKDYVKAFNRLGWSQVERSGPVFLIYPPARVVYGTKPKRPLEGS